MDTMRQRPMSAGWRHLGRAVGALLIMAGPGVAAERVWTVGVDGLDWSDWTQTSAAVDFPDGSGDEGIRMLSFVERDNIVEQLRWTATGTPQDYITKRPNGRVWDNNPLRDPLATLSVVDGDSTTSTGDRFKQPGAIYEKTSLFFDLGTRFPVSRFSFFPRQTGTDAEGRPYEDDFVRSYEILVQDGERFTDNNLPVYQTPPLRVVQFTTSSIADLPFPLQFARYIRLRVTSNTPFEVAEFQVFGRGFSPRGELLSRVVDLGDDANFSRITWDAVGLRQGESGRLDSVEDADAGVTVRLRTGSTPEAQIYYQIVDQGTGERVRVSETAYAQLRQDQKGGTQPGESWSPWSTPLTVPDVRIDLPSPRRYFQFSVDMDSRAILDGAGLRSLSVRYATPPLARALLAEISLADEPAPPGGTPVAPVGEFSRFVYDVRADVRRSDVGFNALEISTPDRPVFESLSRGGPSWTNLAPIAQDSVTITDSSLVVYFQPVRSLEYLRVMFAAQLFRQATSFDAQAHHTQEDEPPQKVLPGDAHPGIQTLEGNSLRVLTSAASARTLMPSLEIAPAVVTPNGDGINDDAAVSYVLTQLLEPVPVTIRIFDLAGRCVRQQTLDQGSGAHVWHWDGRDGGTRRLPPGTYLVRVSLEADWQSADRLGVIAVAY